MGEVHPKEKGREESDQSRDPDGQEPQNPRPVVDGERIKGKYTLRKIQPIERYCPIGKLSIHFYISSTWLTDYVQFRK